MLTRTQLLEACNLISLKYGGSRVGCVMGYRNQHLIAVELHDTRQINAALAALTGREPEPGEFYIRLGFCQTHITRAPDGGWSIWIGPEVLERCWTPEDVLAYFETMIGRQKEREQKLRAWNERMARRGTNRDARVGAAVLAVREMQEALAEEVM